MQHCPLLLLSRLSTLTRDIDITFLSVCLSVRDVPVSDENGLTYCHIVFLPYGSPIILVFISIKHLHKIPISNCPIFNDLERCQTQISRSDHSLLFSSLLYGADSCCWGRRSGPMRCPWLTKNPTTKAKGRGVATGGISVYIYIPPKISNRFVHVCDINTFWNCND